MHTGNYFIENRKLANGERSAAHTCTLEHSHTHPLYTLSRISAHSHRHERERERVSRAPLSARRVRQKQPRQHITRAVGNPRVFPPARAPALAKAICGAGRPEIGRCARGCAHPRRRRHQRAGWRRRRRCYIEPLLPQ